MKQSARESLGGKISQKTPNGLRDWSISAIRSIMRTRGSFSGRSSASSSTRMQKSRDTPTRSSREVTPTRTREGVIQVREGTAGIMEGTGISAEDIPTGVLEEVEVITQRTSTITLTRETSGGHAETIPAAAATRKPKTDPSGGHMGKRTP